MQARRIILSGGESQREGAYDFKERRCSRQDHPSPLITQPL